MKILITGASGKIGQVVAKELSSKAELILLDRSQQNPVLEKLGKLVNIDLLDAAAVKNLLTAEKPDVVIHLAGIVGKAAENSSQLNVTATKELALAAALAGSQKFIFASSSAVYPTAGNDLLSEAAENLQPESEYGKQKHQAEIELAKVAQTSQLQIICFRIFNVYGPGFENSLVNKLVEAAKADGPEVKIIDPEHFVRDYIHVNDVAVAFAAVISNLKSTEKFLVINVGSGVATSTANLLKELTTLGITPRINLESGELRTSVVADIDKAQELLGFKPHQTVLVNQL